MSVGAHVNRYHAPEGATIAAHIEAARAEAEGQAGFRLTAAAIFVGGPRARRLTLGRAEAAELREYSARTGIRVVAHSAYTAVPWRGDPDAAKFIRAEAAVCQAAGLGGLVVHLPKAPPAQAMKYMARLHNPEAPGVRVYLETPAVRPAESHYETPAKLAALFRAIREALDPELRVFGLCVDTAHLSVNGVDLSSYEKADKWLAELESLSDVIPPEAVLFHINDSMRPLGVGPDAHAPLMQGEIWKNFRREPQKSGLAAFMDYAQRHGTICILERKPKESLKSDYLVLRDLVSSARLPASEV